MEKRTLAKGRLAGGCEESEPGNSLKKYEGTYWRVPRRRKGIRKQKEPKWGALVRKEAEKFTQFSEGRVETLPLVSEQERKRKESKAEWTQARGLDRESDLF